MITRNGKVHRLEEGVPGNPRIHHLSMQRACERWLAARGLVTAPNFRNSDFIFGAGKRRARK